MPKNLNLSTLVIVAQDDLSAALRLREFLRMALDQLEGDDQASYRAYLLVDSFLMQSEPHLDELVLTLQKLNNEIRWLAELTANKQN